MWYLSRVRSEDVPRAREFFNRALELDPMLARRPYGTGDGCLLVKARFMPLARSRKHCDSRGMRRRRLSNSTRPMLTHMGFERMRQAIWGIMRRLRLR